MSKVCCSCGGSGACPHCAGEGERKVVGYTEYCFVCDATGDCIDCDGSGKSCLTPAPADEDDE